MRVSDSDSTFQRATSIEPATVTVQAEPEVIVSRRDSMRMPQIN